MKYQAILFIRSIHVSIITASERSRLYHWESEFTSVQ